jgi:histidinol dehydrogenase
VRATPDALVALGPAVMTLAAAEGLPAHADSVRRRLDALPHAPAPQSAPDGALA